MSIAQSIPLADANAAFFDETLRRALRQTLATSGIPAQHVDEITDVSCHAAQQAIEAMLRIIFAHSDARVATCALGVAASLLNHRITDLIDAQKAAAEECGMPAREATVQVRR